MGEANHISKAVGERLREWRETLGVRQEEVAWEAREYGLDWKAATVGVIETGRRNVSVQELLVLPLIVAGFPHDQQEHFARPGYFLGPFAGLLEGPGSGEPNDALRTLALQASSLDDPEDPIIVWAQGEAERNAARTLSEGENMSLSPYDVARLARDLWGRSLSDERDARAMERARGDATARSLQAHRGHVTRELIAELEEAAGEKRAVWDQHAKRLWGRAYEEEIAARVAAGEPRRQAQLEVRRAISDAMTEGDDDG